jgi:hypothetical protein
MVWRLTLNPIHAGEFIFPNLFNQSLEGFIYASFHLSVYMKTCQELPAPPQEQRQDKNKKNLAGYFHSGREGACQNVAA